MVRIALGAIVGGLVQFIVGALAWATPLGRLAFGHASEAATADLQTALARTLTPTGTGTYFIPDPETAQMTTLLGKGPVALVMFNTGGFPPMNAGALLTGLALSVGMLFLVGLALAPIADFAARMRALLLIAVATVGYFVISLPVYNFYMPWTWWTYLAVESFLAFVAGGFVMLRFFMPKAAPESVPQP